MPTARVGHRLPPCLAAALAVALLALPASAQTDEIQVYDASIADLHQFTLTFHSNYVIAGDTAPAFPGAVVADHSLNGALEWAYGVTDWFEAGLYLPVWSRDAASGLGYDGFKLRALFVSPHADARSFAYGVNFEFSVNQPRWSASHYGGEIRGILAWHLAKVDLVVNPIVDTDYNGLANLELVPCWRAAYNASPAWAFGIEQYSDFGPVSALYPWSEQSHQLFAVVDRHWQRWDAELGVGYGLTTASDPWTVKVIVTTALNSGKADGNGN